MVHRYILSKEECESFGVPEGFEVIDHFKEWWDTTKPEDCLIKVWPNTGFSIQKKEDKYEVWISLGQTHYVGSDECLEVAISKAFNGSYQPCFEGELKNNLKVLLNLSRELGYTCTRDSDGLVLEYISDEHLNGEKE